MPAAELLEHLTGRPPRTWRSLHLTGGPCAGKSTAKDELHRLAGTDGIRVIMVPEVASMLIDGGFSDIGLLAAEDPDRYLVVQGHGMIGIARALREQYTRLAEALGPDPVLLVFDRAEFDARAYMNDDEFFGLCAQQRLTVAELWSYDAVVHMVTAAQGAEQHYTLANNTARRETPEQARELDVRTLRAVTGHPHLRIADNRGSFTEKVDRVVDVALGLFGMPEPVEDERQFLLAAAPELRPDGTLAAVDATAVEVEQTYLHSGVEGLEARVRRRTWMGQSAYTVCVKDRRGDGPPVEHEENVDAVQYAALRFGADLNRRPIVKTRFCFPYRASYCELDRVAMPDGDELWKLEIEKVTADERIDIPDFLDIAREVTGDPAFSMARIAATPARS